jgi:hypothetical protein
MDESVPGADARLLDFTYRTQTDRGSTGVPRGDLRAQPAQAAEADHLNDTRRDRGGETWSARGLQTGDLRYSAGVLSVVP